MFLKCKEKSISIKTAPQTSRYVPTNPEFYTSWSVEENYKFKRTWVSSSIERYLVDEDGVYAEISGSGLLYLKPPPISLRLTSALGLEGIPFYIFPEMTLNLNKGNRTQLRQQFSFNVGMGSIW